MSPLIRALKDRNSLSSQESRPVTFLVFLPLRLLWICLEFCLHSSYIVAQIHTKLQVKLNFFGSFCLSFFFLLKKVKWLCSLKSYSRLCAICWNQIPFTQSWMFPWQKPELDKFKKPVNKKGGKDRDTHIREKRDPASTKEKEGEAAAWERGRKILFWVGASKCLSPNLYHLQKFCLLECQRGPLQSASVLFVLHMLVLLHITWHLLHKHELHICTV